MPSPLHGSGGMGGNGYSAQRNEGGDLQAAVRRMANLKDQRAADAEAPRRDVQAWAIDARSGSSPPLPAHGIDRWVGHSLDISAEEENYMRRAAAEEVGCLEAGGGFASLIRTPGSTVAPHTPRTTPGYGGNGAIRPPPSSVRKIGGGYMRLVGTVGEAHSGGEGDDMWKREAEKWREVALADRRELSRKVAKLEAEILQANTNRSIQREGPPNAAELRLRKEVASLRQQAEQQSHLRLQVEAELARVRAGGSPTASRNTASPPSARRGASSTPPGSARRSWGGGMGIRFLVRFEREGWGGGSEGARRAIASAAGVSEYRLIVNASRALEIDITAIPARPGDAEPAPLDAVASLSRQSASSDSALSRAGGGPVLGVSVVGAYSVAAGGGEASDEEPNLSASSPNGANGGYAHHREGSPCAGDCRVAELELLLAAERSRVVSLAADLAEEVGPEVGDRAFVNMRMRLGEVEAERVCLLAEVERLRRPQGEREMVDIRLALAEVMRDKATLAEQVEELEKDKGRLGEELADAEKRLAAALGDAVLALEAAQAHDGSSAEDMVQKIIAAEAQMSLEREVALSLALSDASCERDALQTNVEELERQKEAISVSLRDAIQQWDVMSKERAAHASDMEAMSAKLAVAVSERDALAGGATGGVDAAAVRDHMTMELEAVRKELTKTIAARGHDVEKLTRELEASHDERQRAGSERGGTEQLHREIIVKEDELARAAAGKQRAVWAVEKELIEARCEIKMLTDEVKVMVDVALQANMDVVEMGESGAQQVKTVREELEEAREQIERLKKGVDEKGVETTGGTSRTGRSNSWNLACTPDYAALQVMDVLTKELEETQAEVQGLKSQLKGSEDKADAFRKDLEDAHGEVDALRKDLEGAHGEVDALRKDLEGAHGEVDAFKKDLQVALGEVDALTMELTAKEDELHTAKEASGGEVDALMQKLAKMEAELDVAVRSRSDWDTLKAKLAEKEAELDVAVRSRSDWDTLKAKLAKMEAELAEAGEGRVEVDVLKLKIEDQEKEASRRRGEAETLEGELRMAKGELEELRKRLEAAMRDVEGGKEQLAQSEKERRGLEEDAAKSTKAEEGEIVLAKRTMEEAIAGLEGEVGQIETTASAMGKEVEELLGAFSEKVDAVEVLKGSMRELEVIIGALQKSPAYDVGTPGEEAGRIFAELTVALKECGDLKMRVKAAEEASDEHMKSLLGAEDVAESLRRSLDKAQASERDERSKRVAEEKTCAKLREEIRAQEDELHGLLRGGEVVVSNSDGDDASLRDKRLSHKGSLKGFTSGRNNSQKEAKVSELEALLVAEKVRAAALVESERASADELVAEERSKLRRAQVKVEQASQMVDELCDGLQEYRKKAGEESLLAVELQVGLELKDQMHRLIAVLGVSNSGADAASAWIKRETALVEKRQRLAVDDDLQAKLGSTQKERDHLISVVRTRELEIKAKEDEMGRMRAEELQRMQGEEKRNSMCREEVASLKKEVEELSRMRDELANDLSQSREVVRMLEKKASDKRRLDVADSPAGSFEMGNGDDLIIKQLTQLLAEKESSVLSLQHELADSARARDASVEAMSVLEATAKLVAQRALLEAAERIKVDEAREAEREALMESMAALKTELAKCQAVREKLAEGGNEQVAELKSKIRELLEEISESQEASERMLSRERGEMREKVEGEMRHLVEREIKHKIETELRAKVEKEIGERFKKELRFKNEELDKMKSDVSKSRTQFEDEMERVRIKVSEEVKRVREEVVEARSGWEQAEEELDAAKDRLRQLQATVKSDNATASGGIKPGEEAMPKTAVNQANLADSEMAARLVKLQADLSSCQEELVRAQSAHSEELNSAKLQTQTAMDCAKAVAEELQNERELRAKAADLSGDSGESVVAAVNADAQLVAALRAENTKLEMEVCVLRASKDSAENAAKVLQGRNVQLEMMVLTSDGGNGESEPQDLDSVVAKLKNELKDARLRAGQLQQDNERIESVRQALEGARGRLLTALEAAQGEAEVLKKFKVKIELKVQDLEKDVEKQMQRAESANAAASGLLQKIGVMEQEIARVKGDAKTAVADLERKVLAAREAIYQARNTAMVEQKSAKAAMDTLERVKDECRQVHIYAQNLQDSHSSMERRLAESEMDLDRATSRITALSSSSELGGRSTTEDQLASSTDKIAALEVENMRLIEQIEKLRQTISFQEEKARSVATTLANSERERSEAHQGLKVALTRLAEYEKDVLQLRKESEGSSFGSSMERAWSEMNSSQNGGPTAMAAAERRADLAEKRLTDLERRFSHSVDLSDPRNSQGGVGASPGSFTEAEVSRKTTSVELDAGHSAKLHRGASETGLSFRMPTSGSFHGSFSRVIEKAEGIDLDNKPPTPLRRLVRPRGDARPALESPHLSSVQSKKQLRLAAAYNITDLPHMDYPWDVVRGATCLYDYDAGETDELSLKHGQRLVIIGLAQPEWYLGDTGTRIGILPSNYVVVDAPDF